METDVVAIPRAAPIPTVSVTGGECNECGGLVRRQPVGVDDEIVLGWQLALRAVEPLQIVGSGHVGLIDSAGSVLLV